MTAPRTPSPTDALRAFGEQLIRMADRLDDTIDFPVDETERAHGVRHALRQAVMAIQSEVEYRDTWSPKFHVYEQPWLQWGGPNPDNVYSRAAIDPQGTYRVTANVRGLRTAIFSLVDGDMHLGKFGVFSETTLGALDISNDGLLELWIAPSGTLDATRCNVMTTHPDARMLLVRQYQSDWELDSIAKFGIERVDEDAMSASKPFDAPRNLVEGIDSAGAWMQASLDFWRNYAEGARNRMTHNQVGPPATPPGGAPTIAYGALWWSLAPGEALVITSNVPDADYWGWTLHTRWWLDSGNFDLACTSLNHVQAHIDTDDSYRIVVTDSDPGVPNWIDTGGRSEGMLVYRYVGARTKPLPVAGLVSVQEVASFLPQAHPTVTAEDRRQQLRLRSAAIHRRS